MRVLLDTHALIWWDEGKLPRPVVRTVQRADDVFVSAASAWEIAIKVGLGRLRVRGSLSVVLDDYGFRPLAVTIEHGERVASLPLIHRDPFDRMLVAQALVDGLTIVTKDPLVRQYAVPSSWT